MAKLNKAERFVKRTLHEKFGFYMDRNLSYDKDRAWNEVYNAVCTDLKNPKHWPHEYSDALSKFCQY